MSAMRLSRPVGRAHFLSRTLARAYTTRPPTRSQPSLASTPTTSSAVRGVKTTPQARVDRVLSRLPPSMQRYTSRLRDAPVSHVVAFLVLHELTAIVPLLALVALFHYVLGGSSDDNAVLRYMVDNYGEQVEAGIERFARYFRKKGWLDETDGSPEADGHESGILSRWSDARYRLVVEVGLAYAITKVLLPVRIAASLSATPWFARILQKFSKLRK